MEHKALLGIVLFPLMGAIINGLLGRGPKEWKADRTTVHLIACLSVASAFGLALWSFYDLFMLRHGGEEHAALSYTAYHWFSLGLSGKAVPVNVRFVMDALS